MDSIPFTCKQIKNKKLKKYSCSMNIISNLPKPRAGLRYYGA